jgi:putative transposase
MPDRILVINPNSTAVAMAMGRIHPGCDGAGWHGSQGLVVPGNITLLEPPPGLRRGRLYSPELNPVERIWHYLRSHWLANSVFRSLADIMDACEMA